MKYKYNGLTVEFDMKEALKEYKEFLEWHPEGDINKKLDYIAFMYTYMDELHDANQIPQEVIEKNKKILCERIGGTQMKIEDLPSFPTLWWEDSIWKKD